MDIETITDKIIKILFNKFNVSKKKLTDQDMDSPLTGQLFGFTALDLAYLLLEVEKEFDCVINMNQIKSYEWNTIKGISEVINNTID